jgi:hypothetical protein
VGRIFHTSKKAFPWLIAKSYYSKDTNQKSVGRIFLNRVANFTTQKNIFLIFQKKNQNNLTKK